MLDHFGGNRRKSKFRWGPVNHYGLECYHVNARYSKTLEDVGELQFGKIILVLFYCMQALWCRFRYGVDVLYYIPAPGKPIALYRDWLVMLICRPFYKKIIFHWLASGLAKWLETSASIRTRSLTFERMKYADASIVLSSLGQNDPEKLMSRRILVVAGGITDPCPAFANDILPRRRLRVETRKKIFSGESTIQNESERIINVLFLAHCTRQKGAFDTIEAVGLANESLAAEKSLLRFRLTLIGAFASDTEEKELRGLIRRPDLKDVVNVLGFVSNEQKNRELLNADIYCFPSYHLAEAQPASLIEALAFGLPIVTTRWRSIPEMFPEDYPGFVEPRSPAQVAERLRLFCVRDMSRQMREIYQRRFTLEKHLEGISEAIRSVE